jgi:hypothetical protein
LELREGSGPFLKSEGAHTCPDRPGGDEHHFFAGQALGCDLLDELAELVKIQLFLAVGQNPGAEFDHHPVDSL